MNVAIYIGENKLDLFKDETIEITSSITNVNDISKNTLDYSKNFTLPASDNNNKIFKHWYNPDIDFGFDARTKVGGRIEINGVVFKYGKFSLLSVKLKQNKPSSYSLVFYGNAISLVDKAGGDELSNLDLSAFDHAYNDANVYEGLKNSLFSGDIVYPLMAKKGYYYNTSITDDGVESDLISNIANVSWANGIDWKDLRAAIRLIRVIEAIETKYGFTFSREFFNRVEFLNLYLWLENEKQKEISTEVEVDFDNIGTLENDLKRDYFGDDSATLQGQVDLANNTYEITYHIEPSGNFWMDMYMVIHPSAGYESVPYTVYQYNNEDKAREGTFVGIGVLKEPFEGVGIKYSWRVKSSVNFKFTSELKIQYTRVPSIFINSVFAEQTINVNYTISNQLPKLKVIDFLKGLFQMFKLVIVQDKSTDPIYVNTLKDYYSTADLYDVTPYISTKEMDIERGKLLNEIIYKYEDPQTILAKEFKENTGLGYGDNELILKEDMLDPNSKKIDGEKEEIKLPFEQVVYERLNDANTNTLTNIQAASIVDDKFEPVNLKPHIFYNVKNRNGSYLLKFRNNNGTSFGFGAAINTPSHTIDFSEVPSHSLVFDREFSTYTAAAIDNTIYTNYHNEYIESIFQVKRRNTKVEAKLPLRIILNLKLKDVIKIKENYYRLNTWTYNLLTGIAKLDLINSFDNTINGFNADRTIIDTNGTAKIESIYVTNFTNMIFDYTAYWISSATYLGNNVYFGIDANDTGLFRTEIVTLINTDTLAEIEITINQTPNIITFGNGVIIWGSTEITFDL